MNISTDYSLIKKPHQKTKYTKHDLEEFAKCADPISGCQYFINNYYYTRHPIKGKTLYKAYDYQERMLDIIQNNRKSVLLCGRQLGKTTTVGGYVLWYATFVPDMTILIAAHTGRFVSEIMARIKYAYEFMPDFLRAGTVEYNKQSISFDNGSRIIAQTTTPTTGRGYSVGLFFVDELASVPQNIQKEFWASISPTLSTGGKIIISSTPQSDEDQFSEIWHNANKTEDEFGNTLSDGLGVNGFKAFKAIWSEHPERDQKWADVEKSDIGEEKFLREHNCEFIIDSETLINPFVLNQLSGIEPIELQGQIRWYKKPKKGNIYLVALDPSIGTGGNLAAIQVLEANTNTQIAEWCNNKTSIEKQVDLLKEITTYLVSITEQTTNVYWSIESNTVGEATLVTIRNIGEENIPGVFLSEPVKLGQSKKFRKGFNTTNTSKLTACAKLKSLIESKKIFLYSKKLISELKTFVSIGNTYQAKIGSTDDLVCSMLVIIRMMETLKDYIPELQDIRDIGENAMPLPFIMSTSSNRYY
jgi:hypothetical protein